MQKKLPLLLRCALESHVRVRSVETFQKSLDNLRTRLRVSTVESRNPDRTRMLPPAAPNKRQHDIARSLASPYVKLQDARGHYAPQLKEYLTSQQLRIHLRNSTGKSIFHAPTSNARVARTRMPPQAPNPNRAGFCEVCTCQCDNMNQVRDRGLCSMMTGDCSISRVAIIKCGQVRLGSSTKWIPCWDPSTRRLHVPVILSDCAKIPLPMTH
jgi:hypothetical protein